MNSESKYENDIAVVKYLDETLEGEQLRQFNERLRTDPELRAFLRETSEQAVMMADLGRGQDLGAVPKPRVRTEIGRHRFSPAARNAWVALAASLAVVAGALFWMSQFKSPPSLATVDFVDGAVQWFGSESDLGMELAPGDSLAAGNLMVDSATGVAQFTFLDGTRVTVTGESNLSITEGKGKRLRLQRGDLMVEAVAQAAGQPLVVQTSSAELEVLGTVFSVSSAEDRMTLSVDEGMVQVRRLADGASTRVSAGQRVTTTLDSSRPLALQSADTSPVRWRLEFEELNARVTRGERVSVGGVSCFQGEPYIAARGKNKTHIIRRGVAINSLSERESAFVQLTPDSHLRIRYRSDRGPTIFLTTQKPNGKFGGNFEYDIQQENVPVDEDGWSEISIPIREFELLQPMRYSARGFQISENRLTKILISTAEQRRVMIAEVEVIDSSDGASH